MSTANTREEDRTKRERRENWSVESILVGEIYETRNRKSFDEADGRLNGCEYGHDCIGRDRSSYLLDRSSYVLGKDIEHNGPLFGSQLVRIH